MIRESIVNATGDPKFAKFITQGLGRAYGGLDISRRIGLPIPGQDILLAILGISGKPSVGLGVSGSLLNGIASAWNEFNNGGSTSNILGAITPVAASNVFKAVSYSQNGVRSGGQYPKQLVTSEDVTAKTILARAMGITSDQVATAREQQAYARLIQTKHQTATLRFKEQISNIQLAIGEAQEVHDDEKVKELQTELQSLILKVADYSKQNNVMIDIGAMIRNARKETTQREQGGINIKDVNKAARRDVLELSKTLGIDTK